MGILIVNEVLLVSPSVPYGRGAKQEGDEDHLYPYSIIYLYNYLLKNNIKAKYFDLYVDEEEDLFSYCEQNKPKIIGVTSSVHNRYVAFDIITKLRHRCPESTIIVGGVFFGYYPEETLANIKDVDVVAIGEGEVTMLEIAMEKQMSEIDGIAYRDGDKIIRNKDRKPEFNIDNFDLNYEYLPPPDKLNLITLKNY